MQNIVRGRRGFGLWGSRILMLSTVSFLTGMWAPVTQVRTATAATASGCVGDCNGDGEVTIDELILLVNNRPRQRTGQRVSRRRSVVQWRCPWCHDQLHHRGGDQCAVRVWGNAANTDATVQHSIM